MRDSNVYCRISKNKSWEREITEVGEKLEDMVLQKLNLNFERKTGKESVGKMDGGRDEGRKEMRKKRKKGGKEGRRKEREKGAREMEGG